MKPSETAKKLRRIALAIDNTRRPRRDLVARDLRRIAAAIGSTVMDAINAGEGWIESVLNKAPEARKAGITFKVHPVDPPDLWKLEASYNDGLDSEFVSFDASSDIPWETFVAGVLNRYAGTGVIDPESPGIEETWDMDDPNWSGFDYPGVPAPPV